MSNTSYALSKTSFIKLEQCHKAFFLYKNHIYLRDKLSTDKQLTFKRGHDVGYYARQLFPGGKDVSEHAQNHTQALALTAKLIEEKTPVIYEATFLFNRVLVMVDILCLEGEGYEAFEVKSSLKVSEAYLKDACLQYYVIKNVLPALNDIFLVTFNPDYVLQDDLQPKGLFRRRSLKTRAQENFTYFEHRINQANEVLEQNVIPNIAVGKHCFRPYQCDFFGTCWKGTLNDKSIFNIPLIDKNTLFEWYSNGIHNLDQLGSEHIHNKNLLNIKNAILDNKTLINHQVIANFVAGIKQPAAAMDMEIWNPAIPKLKGTRPFEQIPFLVSVFDGTEYKNHFTSHQTDEREAFAQGLIELTAQYATLLVYDKTMENKVIDSLSKNFPQYADALNVLKEKITDLFDIFFNVHYYHPGFKNNFSLKGVAGIILNDVSYTSIGSGLEAMNFYNQYRQVAEPIERERLKQELIDYCNMDCYATFKLADFLIKLEP